MKIIDGTELKQMEQLLAELFSVSHEENERKEILQLHLRVVSIFENQDGTRASEERLTSLTKQTSR